MPVIKPAPRPLFPRSRIDTLSPEALAKRFAYEQAFKEIFRETTEKMQAPYYSGEHDPFKWTDLEMRMLVNQFERARDYADEQQALQQPKRRLGGYKTRLPMSVWIPILQAIKRPNIT